MAKQSYSYLLGRLKEPSTWAGLSVLALMFGVEQVEVDSVINVATALAAAVAVFKRG